jgi:hypothetical protein
VSALGNLRSDPQLGRLSCSLKYMAHKARRCTHEGSALLENRTEGSDDVIDVIRREICSDRERQCSPAHPLRVGQRLGSGEGSEGRLEVKGDEMHPRADPHRVHDRPKPISVRTTFTIHEHRVEMAGVHGGSRGRRG